MFSPTVNPLKSRAPVIPAFIDGGPRSQDLLRDWLWPACGVRVVFGPAIDLSAYYGRPVERDLLNEVTALLMQRILELEPGRRPSKDPLFLTHRELRGEGAA